ncbi:MAG: hypothetical protein U5L75_02885 [Candidatus Campbellbacteria bacterium]|nr:hypothetical protein [Candidatus Campbellbacteria bacterium]
MTTKVDMASPSVYQEVVQDQLRLLSNLGVNPDNHTFRELINGAGEDNEYVCVGCLHPFRFAQVIGVEVNGLEERKLNLAKELKRSQQRWKNNNFWLARPQAVREHERFFLQHDSYRGSGVPPMARKEALARRRDRRNPCLYGFTTEARVGKTSEIRQREDL